MNLVTNLLRIHRNALVSVDLFGWIWKSVSSGQYQVRCRELEERLAVSRRIYQFKCSASKDV